MNPLALSVRDACASLSIGKTTLYALIRAKKLPVVRIGGRTLIPVEGLLRLVDTGNTRTQDTIPLTQAGSR